MFLLFLLGVFSGSMLVFGGVTVQISPPGRWIPTQHEVCLWLSAQSGPNTAGSWHNSSSVTATWVGCRKPIKPWHMVMENSEKWRVHASQGRNRMSWGSVRYPKNIQNTQFFQKKMDLIRPSLKLQPYTHLWRTLLYTQKNSWGWPFYDS